MALVGCHVRFGSEADIWTRVMDARFAPKSGHLVFGGEAFFGSQQPTGGRRGFLVRQTSTCLAMASAAAQTDVAKNVIAKAERATAIGLLP